MLKLFRSTTEIDFDELNVKKDEALRVRSRYPDRVPVLVIKSENCNEIGEIDKKKYLVPKDLTLGQFIYIIRKRLTLKAEKALFVFVNNTMFPTSTYLSELYENNKDENGFLIVTYSGENTFG